MGNQNSEINNERFRSEDWEPVQKLPDCQVWQNRRESSFRIEQYEIYAQNQADMQHEKKMFALRRRNPLLVAAYYLEVKPSEEFCSTHYRQSLYLERIPIRLLDLEHIPYPDFLHLYDSCLKGFAQLARCAGCFLVDEAMIGVNEGGRVKAWLNEDFSKSSPFCGKVLEENMVRSVIETIDRNIDSEQMPPEIPTVRNFLFKNADALNFDTAIWEFGEFVKSFNQGRIPAKLDCIDRVGGIYAIANRERLNENEEASRVTQHRMQIAGFSEISVPEYRNPQNLVHSHNSHFRPQINQNQFAAKEVAVQSPRKPQQQIKFVPPSSPPVLVPSQNHTIREGNHNNHHHHFYSPQAQSTLPSSPRQSQQVYFQQPKQMPVFEPQNHQITHPITSRSPPHRPSQTVMIHNSNHRPIHPVHTFNSPIRNHPTSAVHSVLPLFLSPLKQSQHIYPHHIAQGPVIPQPIYTMPPNKPNAPKFTVEVIPGKVYPQKNSTIFKQNSNANSAPKEKGHPLIQQQPLVDSYRVVEHEDFPPKAQQQSKDHESNQIQRQTVSIDQPQEEKIKDVTPQLQEKVQSNNPHIQHGQDNQVINEPETIQNERVQQSQRKPFLFEKAENNFEALEKQVIVSSSYEVEDKPEKLTSSLPHHEPIPEVNHLAVNEGGVREERMSLWTAGSHDNTVDYEQMQKRLAISFNPAQETHGFTPFAQQLSQQSIHSDQKEESPPLQLHGEKDKNVRFNLQNIPSPHFHSQDNNIRETGHFSAYPAEYVEPAPIEFRKPRHVHKVEPDEDDLIRETGKFNYSSQYQVPSQIENYHPPQSYDVDSYKVDYSSYVLNRPEGHNEATGNLMTDYDPYQQNYRLNTEEDPQQYQPYETYQVGNGDNYSMLRDNDGKTSPDFLQQLHNTEQEDLRTGHEELPREENYTSNYSDYLRGLTTTHPYPSSYDASSSPPAANAYKDLDNYYSSYRYESPL